MTVSVLTAAQLLARPCCVARACRLNGAPGFRRAAPLLPSRASRLCELPRTSRALVCSSLPTPEFSLDSSLQHRGAVARLWRAASTHSRVSLSLSVWHQTVPTHHIPPCFLSRASCLVGKLLRRPQVLVSHKTSESALPFSREHHSAVARRCCAASNLHPSSTFPRCGTNPCPLIAILSFPWTILLMALLWGATVARSHRSDHTT